MSRVNCVIQARMGSTRLPGKVMADLGGRPMLVFMLERLSGLDVDHLIVATTSAPADDVVADTAARHGAAVVRGPDQDVLARYRLAVEAAPCDHVIRLTADCPLADPELVRSVLALHLSTGADYTSNLFPRSFPKGLDVEVVRESALRRAAGEATLPWEHEHVTPFLYRHPEWFRLSNFSHEGEWLGDLRWTVDTPMDLRAVRSVVEAMDGGTEFGWTDALAVLGPFGAGSPKEMRALPLRRRDRDLVRSWRDRSFADTLEVEQPAAPAWMVAAGTDALVLLRVRVENASGWLSASARPRADLVGALALFVDRMSSQFQFDALLVESADPDLLDACRSAGFETDVPGCPSGSLAWRFR
ncbi:MAG: cytidylyltransferase domain-containing protein [Acidimicrobiales bacterium]